MRVANGGVEVIADTTARSPQGLDECSGRIAICVKKRVWHTYPRFDSERSATITVIGFLIGMFFRGCISVCARAWQDCAVLKEVCRTDSGSTPDKPQFNKERCNMTKDKQPGLLYVREDDEYTYYASSMNIY